MKVSHKCGCPSLKLHFHLQIILFFISFLNNFELHNSYLMMPFFSIIGPLFITLSVNFDENWTRRCAIFWKSYAYPFCHQTIYACIYVQFPSKLMASLGTSYSNRMMSSCDLLTPLIKPV